MFGLKVSTDERVTRIVIDRPKALNALSPGMLSELIDVCADLQRNDAVRVVVFAGEGSCFSAGADLPAFLALLAGPDATATADLGRRATNAIAELPQVTVAGIRGHCIGGGLVLAGACDIRVAASDARFMIPELDAGIPLGWGAMEHLVRLVGETLAADLVLSGRAFGAEEALRSRLVSRVVPTDRLDEELESLAATIARKPKIVLRITKRQILAIRGGCFDAREDANALLLSLKDSEALETGTEYFAKRLRSKRAGGRL
ncbi:MAG: enoyl-CoA hydratase/isomerase family protein [Myxococcales bacterium]|nr:enoyl-CoA hydratase/isomerase family protein [Deltaproteobacteria bacterium]NNE18101.1 enoyl-CoA hydratase/isomerase family protein [Myxococcales bacterium]